MSTGSFRLLSFNALFFLLFNQFSFLLVSEKKGINFSLRVNYFWLRKKLILPLRQTNIFLASYYSYNRYYNNLQQLYFILTIAIVRNINNLCKNNKMQGNY